MTKPDKIENTMTSPKSLPRQIIGSATTALAISSVIIGAIIAGTVSYANINQSSSIEECETSYSELLNSGLINETITPEMVTNNCMTIKSRVEALLEKFGGKGTPVYITGNRTTFCGDETTGCVQKIPIPATDETFQIMSISYIADYYFGLEATVAHEYTHVLTSSAETEKLRSNPDFWDNITVVDGVTMTIKNDPMEAVADCGISYFTGKPFTGGVYMKSCTPEQTEAAYAVIEDRY